MGRRFGVHDILAAADRYQEATGRPVTIQYCLLRGVNDSAAQADDLAALVGTRRMHVNLLRYNPTGLSLPGRDLRRRRRTRPPGRSCRACRERGVVAHFRRSRGPDIDAACGQLRQGA